MHQEELPTSIASVPGYTAWTSQANMIDGNSATSGTANAVQGGGAIRSKTTTSAHAAGQAQWYVAEIDWEAAAATGTTARLSLLDADASDTEIAGETIPAGGRVRATSLYVFANNTVYRRPPFTSALNLTVQWQLASGSGPMLATIYDIRIGSLSRVDSVVVEG